MKTSERKARDLAASSYRAQVAAQNIDNSDYADVYEYVDKNWKSVYLPVILKERQR